MQKSKNYFQCQSCGFTSLKWLGKCPDCGAWNSITEERKTAFSRHRATAAESTEPRPLSAVVSGPTSRFSTCIGEFDRVLGGGVVPGSVILVGGDPGIGKSTLLLQAFSGIAGKKEKVLYVSGEESPEQVKIRAERLSIESDRIMILPETSVEAVIQSASGLSPRAMVIDSIQTAYTEEMSSAPGAVSQVRECAAKLMSFAKKSDIPVFLIGHVTKEGAIAGPRVLEHIVDTVLYFEGEKGHAYRILRAVKNRFGPTNEIGIFEMSDAGLSEVGNPSELFLLERSLNVSGSTVVASMEGTRPLMVEIQSLVSRTNFGMPRRTAIGVDYNRVNLLVAVLEKKAGLQLGGMDIFVNVVGGLKLIEPAVDLGIVVTLVSSFREIPVPPDMFFFGEVGLSGEIRAVAQADTRIREAAKIGFKRALLPSGNAGKIGRCADLQISGVRNVQECLDTVFH
jgi:DNA repair protein RadA/Sms